MARLEIDIIGRNTRLIASIRESEKALDRLIAKSKQVRNINIGGNFSGFIGNLNKVNQTLDQLIQKLQKVASASASIKPPDVTPVSRGAGGRDPIGYIGRLSAAYIGLHQAIQLTQKTFSTAMRVDALETSFGFVIEDSTERLAALREQANRLGVDFLTLAETNKKFIAAANASNFELEKADAIFNSVANAGAKLKLSNEQIGGTFLAIEQMISKGTVSMEELRRQLGDRLPGAFAMAARAMGMTEAAFNKAVANGEILSKDLLPLLAKELDNVYGNDTRQKIDSLQASVNRFGNEFTSMVQDGNINRVFQIIVDGATENLSALNRLVNSSSWGEFFARLNPANWGQHETISDAIGLKEVFDNVKRLNNEYSDLMSKWSGQEGLFRAMMGESGSENVNAELEKAKKNLDDITQAWAEYTAAVASGRMIESGDTIIDYSHEVERARAAYSQMLSIQKQFGYDRVAQAKTIEDAVSAIMAASSKEQVSTLEIEFGEFAGQKKFEDAIKERNKALERGAAEAQRIAQRLAADLQRSADETALALLSGVASQEERIRQTYASRLEYARQYGGNVVQLEADMQAQIDEVRRKADEKATKDGEAQLEKRRQKIQENAERVLSDTRKQQAKESEIALSFQRRLYENRAQVALRELNAEYKIKEEALNEWITAEIKANGTSEALTMETLGKKLALQEEYWRKLEPILSQQREIDIQTAFDGDAMSVPIARINSEIEELRRNFQGLTSEEIANFQAKISELEMSRQQLQVIQKTVDGIGDAFGNLYSDAIFDTENAIKNLGESFQSVAKNIVSELIKIGVRYVINQAIASASMKTMAATSAVSAGVVTAAWTPAAAVTAVGSWGGSVAAGAAALIPFLASMKGYRSGGYTGNMGRSSVAGVVHGQEFVMNADATRRIGVDNLMALQRGDISPSMALQNTSASPISFGHQSVTVHVVGEISGENIKLASDMADRKATRYFR